MRITFRRLAPCAVVVILAAAGAVAKPKPPAMNGLGLSPDQQRKIAVLDKKGRAEVSAAQFGLGTPAEKKTRIDAILKKYRDAEMAVLSPVQRAKVEADRVARLKAWNKVLQVRKSLSPQQRAQASAIDADIRRKANAVKLNKALTDSQKRAQLMVLLAQRNARLKTVLTPEQRQALPR